MTLRAPRNMPRVKPDPLDAERSRLPDPAPIAARGYVRWTVYDIELATETEWPIVEVMREGKRAFAWGEPIVCRKNWTA